MSRYHKEKGLEEAINAFRKVVDVIPDARYEIYGVGEHEKYFQELIEELNLTKNIELKGFTDNKIEVYQKAACSILTSKSEGFGLTILESLAAGTPVTSYDIKYGPKDMIQDEKNGFLVKDQNELSDKIIKVMTEEKTRIRLSKNTKSIFKGFSHKVYQKAWYKLLDELT
ncbi:glycosyltransferase [Bacillus atrophaeus]|nr:glycosyltransferase [Bacillus atrophaeus]